MSEPQYRLEGIVRAKGDLMEDFEGPLDVIFLLLSKNKIEIQNVSITAILEQYLAYLDEMKRLDMEIASEFITMASHLMLIKTKMLLSAAEQEEAQSELDLLRQSLIERQRKEAIEQIRLARCAVSAPTSISIPCRICSMRWMTSLSAMIVSCLRPRLTLRVSLVVSLIPWQKRQVSYCAS